MKAFEGLRNNVVEPTLGRISQGVEVAVGEILRALVHAVDSDPRDTIRREAGILPGRVGDAAREVVSIADEAAFRLATELGLFIPYV